MNSACSNGDDAITVAVAPQPSAQSTVHWQSRQCHASFDEGSAIPRGRKSGRHLETPRACGEQHSPTQANVLRCAHLRGTIMLSRSFAESTYLDLPLSKKRYLWRFVLYLRVLWRMAMAQGLSISGGPSGDPFSCFLLRQGCVPMASCACVFLLLRFTHGLSRR